MKCDGDGESTGHGRRAWAVGAMCVLCLFGGSVTSATPPTSAAEVAAAVAAAAANADGLDNQVGDMMMAMHCFMVKAKCHITANLACVKIVSLTVGVNTRINGEGNFI